MLAASLVHGAQLVLVLVLAVVALWRWNSPLAIPAVMLGAAALGALLGT
jgi:hypothetical protein